MHVKEELDDDFEPTAPTLRCALCELDIGAVDVASKRDHVKTHFAEQFGYAPAILEDLSEAGSRDFTHLMSQCFPDVLVQKLSPPPTPNPHNRKSPIPEHSRAAMPGLEAKFAPELTRQSKRLVEYISAAGKRRLLARRLQVKPAKKEVAVKSKKTKKLPTKRLQERTVTEALDLSLPQGYWYCTRCRAIHDKKTKLEKQEGPKVPMWFVINGMFTTHPEEFENGGHMCDDNVTMTTKNKKPIDAGPSESDSSTTIPRSYKPKSKTNASRKRPAPYKNQPTEKKKYKGVQLNMTKYENRIREKRKNGILDADRRPDTTESQSEDARQKLFDFEEKNKHLESELSKVRQSNSELRKLLAVHGQHIYQLITRFSGFEGVAKEDLLPRIGQ